MSRTNSNTETLEQLKKRANFHPSFNHTLTLGFTKEVVNKTKISKKYIDVASKAQMQELIGTAFKNNDDPAVKRRKMKQIEEVVQIIDNMKKTKN